MLSCCQESKSIRSSLCEDSEINLVSSTYQRQMAIAETPIMNISLDLPGSDMQYLPTYWPGQKITGEVKIHPKFNSPIKVSHLRIALFGNVQVYGDYPGHPMTNGLFDFHKNEQLINTGLRIMRRSALQRPPPPHSPPHLTQDDTRINTRELVNTQLENQNPELSSNNTIENEESVTFVADEQRWKLHCRRDERGSTDDTNNQSGRKNVQKTPEDRHIEKLIRKAAAIHYTSNISNGLLEDDIECYYREETSSAFELRAGTTISFSIRVPTSKRLASTFDHPHYPISHRLVAIMKFRDKENNEITCYSTVRLRLESTLDMGASQYSERAQSNPTRQYVQNNNSLMSAICTQVLASSSVLTYWVHKKVSPNYCSSYIQGHLELPKQAFERSQFIPLQVAISNNAAPKFKISAIKISVELTRRINMTCSINEEVERKVLCASKVLFNSTEEESSEDSNGDEMIYFKHANMLFDLSKLIQVPDDCTSTIAAESTKNVFSLDYVVDVSLDISGIVQEVNTSAIVSPLPPTSTNEEMRRCYSATDKHIQLEERQEQNITKAPLHQRLKNYNLKLDPLTVYIGNSNCWSAGT